jgi:DNA-nicking Smr family endonuclease
MGGWTSRIKSEPFDLFHNFFARGDEISKKYREEANFHAEQCDKFKSLSRQAYDRGLSKQAKEYKNSRNAHQNAMEQANKRAEKAIFNYLNTSNSLKKQIDLHGLHIKEALARLEKYIQNMKCNGFDQIFIVVGQGFHSVSGPKLKPAVINYAEQRQIPCNFESNNPGCIVMDITNVSRKLTGVEKIIIICVILFFSALYFDQA